MLFKTVFIMANSMFSELDILHPNISQGSIWQHRVIKCRCFFLLFYIYYNWEGGKTCGALTMCKI